MKFFKSVIVTVLLLLGVTGCYTQLQYSQGQRGGGYYEDDYAYYDDGGDYVPVYYKDYNTASWWNNCHCDPYLVNNYYSPGYSSWYGYGGRYYDPFYASVWSGFPYYGSRFSFGLSFSWGWGRPHYYSSFYNPYYSHPSYFYHPYWWYGYRPGVSYNYFYFDDGYWDYDDYYRPDRRDGRRRSFGNSRVRDDDRNRNRSRGRVSRSGSRDREQGRKRVRSRSRDGDRGSVGRTRSRGNNRGNVERGRSRSNGSGRVRSRSRSGGNSSGSEGRSRSRNGRNDHSSMIRSRDHNDASSVRQVSIDRLDDVLRGRRGRSGDAISSNNNTPRNRSNVQRSDRKVRVDRLDDVLRSRRDRSSQNRSQLNRNRRARSSRGHLVDQRRNREARSVVRRRANIDTDDVNAVLQRSQNRERNRQRKESSSFWGRLKKAITPSTNGGRNRVRSSRDRSIDIGSRTKPTIQRNRPSRRSSITRQRSHSSNNRSVGRSRSRSRDNR